VQYWIHPIESQLIPRLESGRQTRVHTTLIKLADWCADLGRITVLDLRLDVLRWTGPDWSVTYIGEGESIEAIRTILFPDPPKLYGNSRAYLWHVPGLIKNQTEAGDLVVSELNKILQWSFDELTTFFEVPGFIKQVLDDIDQPLDNILTSMNQSMRRKIRKLEGQGFTYEFTHNKEDFDFFYYRMYLPYITLRHKGQGMVLDDYESTLKDFLQGGMILIRDGEDPVCGMLCHMEDDICRALQMGVLDANFELVKRGINVALWWYMLLWARDQGAKKFDFGSSRAQISDGVFNFKRQWGTRVKLHNGIHTQWSFYAKVLPDKLREYLNELEFITSLDGMCYELMLIDPKEPSGKVDLSTDLQHAAANGLAGLVVISEKGEKQVISQTSN